MSLGSPIRRLSVTSLASLEGWGCGTLGGEGSENGIWRHLLIAASSLSLVPIPMPSYSPSSIKGKALQEEVLSLLAKGAIELAPPSPG